MWNIKLRSTNFILFRTDLDKLEILLNMGLNSKPIYANS